MKRIKFPRRFLPFKPGKICDLHRPASMDSRTPPAVDLRCSRNHSVVTREEYADWGRLDRACCRDPSSDGVSQGLRSRRRNDVQRALRITFVRWSTKVYTRGASHRGRRFCLGRGVARRRPFLGRCTTGWALARPPQLRTFLDRGRFRK
jgi:hypothetical protein